MFTKLILEDFRIFKNQKIELGNVVTAIAGHNATGKSTILGILGNSSELKNKFGTTITDKAFKTEFSELFRGSKEHDKEKGTIGKIYYKFPQNDIETEVNLRVTWQKWNTDSIEKNRFRIIPKWYDIKNDITTERKLPVPSFYLGLSRLFPIGEDNKEIIEEKKFKSKLSGNDFKWLIENYKNILSIDNNIDSISNFELIRKRSGGINTENYDYLSNSAGQDNLMQIMYLLLSFIKLAISCEENGDVWNGGILLIDEIDATLHPAAQIRLINLIFESCKTFKFQVVFTTHSLQILEYLSNLRIKNEGINIEYFTTANSILQIVHNPTFQAMENDMLISNYYLNNSKQKLLIYSEDEEARWFIKKLLCDYKTRIQLIDIKLGCDSLMDLLRNDPDYFKTVLFILDGDKDLSKTKYKDLPRLYCNVLNLPGENNPEEILYNYLVKLPPEHKILQENFDKGISIRTFQEMNPEKNPLYNGLDKKRDKYKKWFNESLVMFDDIGVFDYWCNDNQDIVDQFLKDFINKYNIVASRCNLPKLS